MKLKRPDQTELDQMSHAEKDALILLLFDLFEQLKKRVDELESTVKKTSRNSSIPPSMDGLKKGELGYLSLNKTNYGGKVTRCLLKVLGIKPPKTLGELVPLILAQPKLFAHDSTKM